MNELNRDGKKGKQEIKKKNVHTHNRLIKIQSKMQIDAMVNKNLRRRTTHELIGNICDL